MNRKILISMLLLGALALAIAFGATAFRSVSAATPTPVASTSDEDSSQEEGVRGNFKGGMGHGFTREDLANALGISVDELDAAYQQANDDALDQAMAQGLITQAQADELKADGSTFPFGKHWGGWLDQEGIDFDALLADALGITMEQLRAAYTQAFNTHIDQAVTDGDLTQEQADLLKGQHALYASEGFQSAMQSAFESAVEQAVADGVITQAQADQILANRSDKGFGGFRDFDSPHGLGGFEGGRGFGRHGGWEHGAPNDPTQSTVPTATP
jgi:hypothetical protein